MAECHGTDLAHLRLHRGVFAMASDRLSADIAGALPAAAGPIVPVIPLHDMQLISTAVSVSAQSSSVTLSGVYDIKHTGSKHLQWDRLQGKAAGDIMCLTSVLRQGHDQGTAPETGYGLELGDRGRCRVHCHPHR